MGVRSRLIRAAGVAVTLCMLAGCKSANKEPSRKTASVPLDHLAKDEVVEGSLKAFGLPLPQTAKILSEYDGTSRIVCTLTTEQLANFVRARVSGGSIVAGASGTRFDDVSLRSDPTKKLAIEVRVARDAYARSEMTVRDTTPKAPTPGLSDDERWKRAGLKPDGTPLDPKRME